MTSSKEQRVTQKKYAKMKRPEIAAMNPKIPNNKVIMILVKQKSPLI